MKLLRGGNLPILGFGSCLSAIKAGYRHIDTAQGYGNEIEIGEAVRLSGLARNDIFITSKIEDGYLDLMLIHNALVGRDSRKRIWLAMEKLLDEGKFKSIGVSNYGIGHVEEMNLYAKHRPPAFNQLELHPWLQQREVVEYCHKHGIVVEAYCPLVLIGYNIQKHWSPLPKSDNSERIAQNPDVFDFELVEEDMEKLDAQPQEPALVVAVDNNSTN
ncbi:MAG: hypothetical protein FE78DRAFT_77047 [Acidomyces sp. 'richmondensis']|nr:MAG: hypothetical protein FE78DRAFT_77047 [Acidomyces sp. 'richmondensis']